MTDILVVGGGGYIGRHVCRLLEEHGAEFHAATSKAAGAAPAMTDDRCIIHGFDINDPAAIERVGDYAQVVLLASASVPATFSSSLDKEVTHNLIPYAALLGKVRPGARVLYLSSGGTVYGEAPPMAALTEDDVFTPKSPYGLVKLFIEETIKFHAQARGFDYVILRPSNPIGPSLSLDQGHQKLQGIVSVFLRAILEKGAVKVIGDGRMERDYFDVRDLAIAIVAILKQPAVSNVLWNVGSGVATSINQIVASIRAATGREFITEHLPERPFDVRRNVLDVSKIGAAIGWRPMISLDRSIADTWENMRQGHHGRDVAIIAQT